MTVFVNVSTSCSVINTMSVFPTLFKRNSKYFIFVVWEMLSQWHSKLKSYTELKEIYKTIHYISKLKIMKMLLLKGAINNKERLRSV